MNTYQLGNGGTGSGAVRVPVAVAGGHAFTKIVASTSAPITCAFEADGSPWCWGSGFSFGTKGPTPSATPLRWDAIANVVWTQFAIGQGHVCGLDATGKAWCVGSSFDGLLGDGSGVASATPVAVAGGHVFQEIVAAIEHTCALAIDGQAWCWGQGAELGNGGPVGTVQPTPVAVAGGLHFVHLAAGNGRTCGLAADGRAWCWGEGYGGNLGDGTTAQRLTPVAVVGGHHFVALGGGGISTCGIDTAGKAWCWGSNEAGAVGVPMSWGWFFRSGGTWLMVQTAASGVDHVVPPGLVRQRVLSLPIPLRLLLASQPTMLTPPLQVVGQGVPWFLNEWAGLKPSEADIGAVILIRLRFGRQPEHRPARPDA